MGIGLFSPDDPAGLPQTTRSGVYYEVEPFSYREAWVPGANRTVITCRVDAATSWDWITDMVGEVYVQSIGGVDTLRRYLPEQNPFDSNQWCTKVEQLDQGGPNDSATGSLMDDATGWPFTQWQRYRVTFEGMPFAMRNDDDADAYPTTPELGRYCIRGRRSYVKEQQIPGGGFYQITGAADTPLYQTQFKNINMADVTYTLVRWPVENLPAARLTLGGQINDATFDSSSGSGEGYNFSAGTLLFAGFDDNNRYYDANEAWVCDLVYTFRYVSTGWNKFITKTGSFVEVSSDGTNGGTRPYTTADFNTLFTI